jgi:hypothetical protein
VRKTRYVAALGLTLALGVSGIAFADGATDNVSTVKIGLSKTKLPVKKKDAVKVELNSGVTTVDADNNPPIPEFAAEEVYIDYDKDLSVKLKGEPCTAALTGTTTAAAIAACPDSIVTKTGSAKARIPTGPGTFLELTDLVVTGFRGAAANDLRLHAGTQTLGPGATQVVEAKLVKSPVSGFGRRLSVPNAPDVAGDAGALTAFEATLKKSQTRATCKDKKIKTHAEFVYDDGTKDTADAKIKCKKKQ